MKDRKNTRDMRMRGKDGCDCECDHRGHHRWHHRHKMCGSVYGLGFIGAAIYFISNSTGFWMGVLGFLKAIVWPVFLVYQALKFFGI